MDSDKSAFPLPEPIRVESIPIVQANFKEQEIFEERKNDNENFQQDHFVKHFQQHPIPPPQQLPPPPQQLPQLNYQQQMQHIYYNHPVNAWSAGPPSSNWVPETRFVHMSTPWQQPPIPQYLDPRQSIDLKLVRKNKKKDKRCYTCKPRGKVKHHIINTSSSGNFTFHHDMHKRPVVIITPNRHVEQFSDLTGDEQVDFFKSCKEFIELWNIRDYQLSINFGSWQNSSHSHLHCKIRLADKKVQQMRRDHFEKKKLEKRYNEEIIGPK